MNPSLNPSHGTNTQFSQQPWCTYALHIATFTSLAFAVDPLLLASCWWATAEWSMEARCYAFWAQFIFMFGFTKVVKLMGLFLRNPTDIVYLPVSICFGYFHGLIKLYALITLNMVCFPSRPTQYRRLHMQTSWGSRADGDAHDNERLATPPKPAVVLKTPPGSTSLIRFHIRQKGRQMQHGIREKDAYAAYDSSTSYVPVRVPMIRPSEKHGSVDVCRSI